MEQTQALPTTPRKLRGTVQRRASNLLPALLLLPAGRREDALLFGEWCRTVDDIADSQGRTPYEKRDLLEAWLLALKPGHEESLPGEFREMIARRHLDRHLLSEIVRGMLMDVGETERIRYATFEELRTYCHRVASVVGLLSARIFGASGPVVESYAEQLGIALQLTNILRDVAEDAALGRIYIPMEDRERFGVSEDQIIGALPSPAMTHLLNHQAERADSYFAKAELAWSEMTVNQRRLMRPARLMSGIYRDLLLQMHRDRYDVFAKRYRVPVFRKFLILLRVMTTRN
jgi:15-cis-phytoene synthase